MLPLWPTEGRPTPTWGLCSHRQLDRGRQVEGSGAGDGQRWRHTLGSPDCLKCPLFLWTLPRKHLPLFLSRGEKNRAPPTASLTGTYTKKQPKNQIQWQRAEGRSPRAVRQTRCPWSHSTALRVPRLCVCLAPHEAAGLRGLLLHPCSQVPSSHGSAQQALINGLMSSWTRGASFSLQASGCSQNHSDSPARAPFPRGPASRLPPSLAAG